ncbi:uncharacterized protein J4E87_003965 [Alternaria ethzedia]|uniref:uncharacterized protein n=1 Tax=Alternaria ethzedia TaxID=181014 RepID=UPI0020C263E3|nr:uncharacterized protein J4E87_003965 [Alternaria ethzedia]KAI4627402.1 hypothetical protein J4E87_003965 [Alternaria ethzedia]
MNSEVTRNKACYEEQSRTARHEEKKRHEQEISSLKQQLAEEHWKWDAYLREVKDTYETRITKLEASFNEQMATESEKHSEQMRQEMERHEGSVKTYQSNIAQLKIDAEHEEQRLREQLQTEQEKLQEEQKRREKELKRQEAQLTHKHTHETLQLRTVNEELKQGLFQRQHFRGLKDRDVGNLFRSIAGQVQDFANVDWDSTRTSDWPFSEHQLLDIHRQNTRKLKKQIVQNTVWVLLHDRIFASPFKILGSEGEVLDREWVEIHTPSKSWIVAIPHIWTNRLQDTSSLEWPEIPEETEKRRYETAKLFLACMEPSTRPSGDDLRLKNGYERSISELLDTLHHALGKVATLQNRQANMLESLVRLCAKTWIEFCSQPYRLIASLPEGSGDLLSLPKLRERALTLVLSPELKRYGNSKGEHLTNGEMIPGCQAAKVSYSVR